MKIKETKKPISSKKAVGRPSAYKPEYARIAKHLASMGIIDKTICEVLNVSEATLCAWKKQFPEFLKAINEGKAEPDRHVEAALYKRALGYEYDEIIERPMPQPKGAGRPAKKMEVSQITHKQIAPDVIAQIFWLKNRRPDRWREKQDIEHSGSIGYKIIPDDLSKEIKEDA